MNTAQGCGLKVACVSAAVSDESMAGDSGVYEASVQRWVAESWISENSESAEFEPPRCVGEAFRRACPSDPTSQPTPTATGSPVWSCAKDADSAAPPTAGSTSGRALVPWLSLGGVRLGEQVLEKGQPLQEGSGAVLGREGQQRGWAGQPRLSPEAPPAPSQTERCPWRMTLVPGRRHKEV